MIERRSQIRERTLAIDKLRENILKEINQRLFLLPFVVAENENNSDIGRCKGSLKRIYDRGPGIAMSVHCPIWCNSSSRDIRKECLASTGYNKRQP